MSRLQSMWDWYDSQGSLGNLVRCRTVQFSGLFEAQIAEAIGLKEALSWVGTQDIPDVLIEMDAKNVADCFHSLHQTCLRWAF
ncbi:conserved hypothetical protein [Ricinus communis]|uniref:RNase H type-1 domain-containing protein n=1 Tax=Ricinus communis TaxID=3988 RepID=B9SWX8_RICCO|nr:conserved hypothetical protein [Ricinus communis]